MASITLPLFSYLGWSFLPNIITQFVQNVYYRLTIRAGTPHPQPGTPLYARDHRRIRILVLSLYLLYTLAQSLYDVKIAGDFYTLLGVDPYLTSDKEIRSRLRRLAAKYHPDKLSSEQATSGQNTENLFLTLRLASETLTNPSHKYAYTHFGPNVLTYLPRPSDTDSSSSSQSTTTAKQSTLQTADLVTLALRQQLPNYLLTLLSILVLNTFFLPRNNSSGKFWRYLIITISFTLEFYLLTHEIPALPSALDTPLHYLRTYTSLGGSLLPPHLLPFQIQTITSRLALSLNIFISQISALFPSSPSSSSQNDTAELKTWLSQLTTNLSLLQTSSQRLDQESTSLLQLQFAPFKGQRSHVNELRRGMKEGMVLGSVKGHPEVREAVQRVVERRKGRSRNQREEWEKQRADREVREDGADVVDLLDSDEQFN